MTNTGTYAVTISGGSRKVAATDPTNAAQLGLALHVEAARTYNAKYAAQHRTHGVAWAIKSENVTDYTVTNVRCVRKPVAA